LIALAAAGLMAATGGSRAQQTVHLEPSDTQRCLTGPVEPEYPFAAWKRNQAATVEAKLRFDGPDRAPEAELRASTRDGDAADFLAAVKAHVAALRLPCMAAGSQPVRLTQVYDFRADGRKVYPSRPTDDDDPARRAALRCITRPASGPEYPTRAARENIQGNVVALVRYEAPDRPPMVRLHARPDMRPLLPVVEEFLAGFRMTCLAGSPVEVAMSFVFRLNDDVKGFKPLTLTQLLGSIRGLPAAGLELDTRPMGCPFDLSFWYRQPFLPNVVDEIASTDPARRSLIGLLEQVELLGSTSTLNAIYGDTTTITVPCLQIAIPPQEKSS
jgi:hypothetical protein